MKKSQKKSHINRKTAYIELARRQAIKKLLPFTFLTMPTYQASWHHQIIAQELEKIESGEIKRLMIFLPPRHGKSELVSIRFPAWYLGKHPERFIIFSTYGAELANDFGRRVRNLVADEIYQEIFPNCIMSQDSSSVHRWNTNHGGSYIATGVHGPIVGRGAHVLIIDDPIKNQDEAFSTTTQQSLWEWYTSVAYPRLSPEGAIILIMTRWGTGDLAGRLLEESKLTGDAWQVISFPAIAEQDEDYRKTGEALWPSAYSIEKLTQIRNVIGSREFQALYQQQPTTIEGGIFKRSWWKYYKQMPEHFDIVIQSWDMTFKEVSSGSYVVCQIWGKLFANYYLLDLFRQRLDFVKTIKLMQQVTAQWPQAMGKLVEATANGPAVVSLLRNEIPGLIEINPKGSKESRANAIAPLIEAGNVWLPEKALWLNEFLDEVSAFPDSMHDDQVDALTQALNYLSSSKTIQLKSDSIFGPNWKVLHAW